ncbi:hypothetical protein [Lysobacter enzymogenes]|uniref:hypothetical protein n=1 Tax=Lysobacter enzymogenes TaxID=69 RepID=UPI001A963696|nr:hypothetical protein [Lysobacter enzymogenes]QQP98588.1 hypothetical protein JHW38_11660 [Lysobacter enzymogenes]
MSGLWDAQQREWLQAMGYSVLALAGDESAAPAAEAPVRGEGARSRSGERGDGARSDNLPRESARRPAAAPERRAADAGDALLRNLLRAARREPGDADVQALFDPAGLRAPAAKRALWPRLRALRRAGARGPRG